MDDVFTHDVYKGLKRLLKRLDVHQEEVVVIKEDPYLDPVYAKQYLESIQSFMKLGTVTIMGDCGFNTNVDVGKGFSYTSNQERMVLSSGKILQLMTLQQSSIFSTHPSLMLATTGEFSRYFGRPMIIDFPYGPNSIFTDLYDLNAVVLFIGDHHTLYEAKYALCDHPSCVVAKNTCIKDKKNIGYLDFNVNLDLIYNLVFSSKLLLYEDIGNHRLYGVRYKEYIDFVKENYA